MRRSTARPKTRKKRKQAPAPPPPSTPPTAYGYGRVSSDHQADGEKTSLGVQESATRAYFDYSLRETHRWGGFTHDVVSGSVRFKERLRGGQLDGKLRPGDAVIFSKLDRGFRNMRDVVNTVLEWIDRGVQVHFLDLRLDTSSPMGRMMMYVLAAVAEFEKERLKERMRDGMAAAKAKGKPIGGAPYGFKVVGSKPNRYLVPNAPQRAVGREIIRLKDEEGMVTHAIAALLASRGVKAFKKASAGEGISQCTVNRYYHWEKELQAKERWANLKETLLPQGGST